MAQSNVRGTVAGTNDHAVSPLRTPPKIAWEIKLRYRDVSALVVSGNVLVTGNTSGTGGTFAYDTATGKQLWSVPGHIRGGPAVDATAAYAVNDTKNANRFRLSKLDLKTGKALWSVEDEDLGSHDSAPLLTGAQVVLTSRNSSIAGYDVASGRPAFQQALPNPADLSKIRLASAGGMLLLHSVGLPPADSAMLYAIDLAGRQVLWSHAVGRPDKYDPTGKWPTKYFLPVDNGLYYENQQLIVKLTAQ